jgi:predicted ATPase/DNA-binding winged helix-turn-helix (wHTH) protein
MAARDSSQLDRLQFGPFVLTPTKRLLEQDGIAMSLGGRALDILIVLTERAGEIVGKRDLVERVWPDVTVDEGSLRFHVAALRKALGDREAGTRYVTTVPGRGYCFVAPVSKSLESGPHAGAEPQLNRARLPAPLARMVGRDDTVRNISARLVSDRFVNVVGPGGIGKTTVALSVANGLMAEFEGEVRFIDLGTLSDPHLVSSSLATALDLPVISESAVRTIVSYLRDKRMLLIFDSCEHVIEGAAELSETIFSEAPHVHILATSREPLRVEGEHVHRLFPLDYPPDDAGLTAPEALDFPAVQLFMERVAASTQGLTLSDGDARAVAAICRKLDGMALAIELAAGRVAAYGIQGTAALLDDQFALLWHGRRTAAPRHQTLSAMLDWSYNLLPDIERVVLRRFAIFVGSFSLRAAQAIAAEDELQTADVVEAVANLVEKSLVSAVPDSSQTRYRLLDTTCAYAKRKLFEAGEANMIARRHAAYAQASLEADSDGWSELIRPEQVALYADQVGNIRSALEWCFSAEGDAALGTALAAAATSVLLSMSLWQECQRWTERAIAALDDASLGTRRELALQTALGKSFLARHDVSDAPRIALTRALAIAEHLNDAAQQLRLLFELRAIALLSGDARGALQLALRSKAVADLTDDPMKTALTEAELGMSYFIVGDQANAQRHCETALAQSKALSTRRSGHFESDILIQCRSALASTLWLRGFPDRSAALANQIIYDLDDTEDFLLFSNCVQWIIPIFLWRGDWSIAEELIDRFIENAQKHGLSMVEVIGSARRGELLISRGDLRAGIPLLQRCLEAQPLT